VFLPAFSIAALLGLQQPSTPFTVTSGGGDVGPAAVARVQASVKSALQALAEDFTGLPRTPFQVIVHASNDALPAAVAEHHHQGSPGLALLHRQEVHLLWREMLAEPGDGLRSVVKHEVVHILLHQLAGDYGERIPRWFHEGLAQVLAGDGYLGAREQDIVWRARAKTLLLFSELTDGFPDRSSELQLAYAQSYSYVAFLVRCYGLRGILDAVRMVDRDTSFSRGLVRVTGEPTAALHDAWIEYLLHGSGASWRALLDMCFPLSMVLALPILALAMIRRQRVDRGARWRMQADEAHGEPGNEELPEADLGPDDDTDADTNGDDEDTRR
jgi:hypothetical protein